MADTLSPAERSERMSRIRGKNSKPEMKLRSLVHGMGYRYRLHVHGLPGTPDLVFPARHAIIFMHGCFWHQHSSPECRLARMPKSRINFWRSKLKANVERDARNLASLEAMGWRVLIVWECEMKSPDVVGQKVRDFLEQQP